MKPSELLVATKLMKLADLVQETSEINGTTGPGGPDDHTHSFDLRVTKEGDVVGTTGETKDHKHPIKNINRTESVNGHSHKLSPRDYPRRGGFIGRGGRGGGRTPPGGHGSQTGGGTGGGGMTGTGAGTGTPGTGSAGGGGGNGGGGGSGGGGM